MPQLSTEKQVDRIAAAALGPHHGSTVNDFS